MIGNAELIVRWLFNQDKEKIFDINEYKEKRSLTQNSYYWSLLSELSSKLKLSKLEVHKNMLKNYSLTTLITVKSQIDIKEFIKYYEFERECKINGVDFKIYKVFKGSSEMNKNEFMTLLNGLIQECHQQGIPTLTKQEIEKLRYIDEKSNKQ